jgi:hypothetical protein
MPIRFYRSFKILPGVRINVSKSGMSTTIGPRGFKFTFNKHGIRRTIDLPGTGLYATSYVSRNKDKDKEKDDQPARERRSDVDNDDGPELGCFPWGCTLFVLILAVGGYLGADALNLIPETYLSDLLQRFARWVQERGL